MDLNTQQEVHLSHYWNVIRKRWKVAMAILLVVLIGTFLASYFSRPLYRSVMQIQIERESNTVTLDDLFGIAASDQEFMQTQYVLLKSRGLSLRVVDDHKLFNDPDVYPPGIAGKSPAELQGIKESIALSLLSGIEVTPVRNTSLVDIAYVGSSPKLAQKIAEAWGESFIRMNVAKKLESVQQANEFIARQISAVKADLDLSREQLQEYGESRGIISFGENSENVTMQKLIQLNADMATAQNLMYEKQAVLDAIQRKSADATASADPVVDRINNDLGALERDYNEKLSRFREGHPVMKQLSDQIAKTRAARATAVAQAQGKALEAARADVSAASSRLANVREAFNSQRGEAQKLNVDASRYTDLRMAVETKQTLLGTLQKQLNETEVAARLRGSASSNIHLVDHARLPGGRFNLSMKKNLQAAFPLGVVLGLAAIFFLEYMDRSVKTPEELERITTFASLGVIPAAGSVTKQYGYGYASNSGTSGSPRPVEMVDGSNPPGIELLPHTDSRSPISEAYRALRTSLLLASANSPKVIVITSSFQREGKTTTSVNLATVLAQMGRPVLLLDADLRRPRLGKVFPNRMNLGLVNYLAANIPLDDVIQQTEVPICP